MLNPYQFHNQPQQLMGYAESAKKIPSIAWQLAKSPAQKRELEHLWAKDPELAYRYARQIIKKPWPPGEAAIAGNPEYAYRYARQIIKKPWPPGEAVIASDAYFAKLYQKEFKVKLRAKSEQDINQ